MTKKLLLSLCLAMGTTAAMAVPARPVVRTLAQPDGTTLQVYLRGDEHYHYYTTLDGTLLLPDSLGWYTPATPQQQQHHHQQGQQHRQQRLQRLQAARHDARRRAYPTHGRQRGLVILVEFQDNSFASPTAHDDFHRLLNEPGYSDLGGTGSARDYFVDQSMGQYQPDFDTYGPIKLSRPLKYYGENDGAGEDKHATDMVVEACRLLDGEIDFTQYDCNQDGFVDNVFIYYAGYGEATLGDANTIWPHSYDITEATNTPVRLDGVQIGHYACTNEIGSDEQMDGIGTFVHEFSHVLGLPDLYDTNYGSSHPFTPGTWSVIDEGEYNNNSRTPPYYSAYERMAVGWLTPYELKDATTVAISHIGTSNQACIIRTSNENEYYLLENRQLTGWDAYIPGHGMLIWHIDYDPFIWQQNRVNNTSSHQRVDIIEADDVRSDGTRHADPFPGTAGIISFTPETTPAMFTWTGEHLNVPITQITESPDGLITFLVCGGTDALALAQQHTVALPAADVSEYGFTAQWQPVEGAYGYRLNVFQRHKGEPGTQQVDFTGGLAQMPAGWQSSSQTTYAMKPYCGESTPALRLQQDGQYLQSPTFDDDLLSLTLWHRGINAAAGNRLAIQALIDGQWQPVDSQPIANEAGGRTLTYPTLPTGTRAVRIAYVGTGSGSVTIDDVQLQHQGVTTIDYVPGYEQMDCRSALQHTLSGLQPGQYYYYTVQAYNAATASIISEPIQVYTGTQQDAVPGVSAPALPHGPAYDLMGRRLTSPWQHHGIIIVGGRRIMVR